MIPPYVPEISSTTDTSNFDVDVEDARVEPQPPNLGNSSFSGRNLPFVGFSFNRDSKLSDIGMRSLDNAQAPAKTVRPPTPVDSGPELISLRQKIRELE